MFSTWNGIDSHFAALDEFRRRVDSLFDELSEDRRATTSWPRVNLYDAGQTFVITAEVPGVKLEDIQLTVTQDTLTLSGERRTEAPEGYSVHRRERSPIRFSRSFSFPVPVASGEASAELKHGLLKVTLPKAPEAQPKTVTVKAG